MIAAGLCLVTVLTVRGRFYDPDSWWHLRVGQIIWNSHSIPRFDEFSYTTNRHAWIPHEWLAQVSIFVAYKVGGYTGMWVWMALLACLLVVLVYVLCWLYSGNAKVALLGGLTAWFFGTAGLSIRPQMLGYLFLALELLILHLGRSRPKWLWSLPALFALWVNCHGSYALGLLVLIVYGGCSFINLRVGRLVSKRRESEERQRLVLVLALCLLALMLNPIGPKLITYPFDTLTHQSQGLAASQEWQPLDINEPRAAVFFVFAALLVLIFLLRSVELWLDELLLLGIGFGMAIQHARLLFPFGILAAPILCRLLADTWDGYKPERDFRTANAVFMAVFIGILIRAFPREPALVQQLRANSPTAAVEFIRRSGLNGPMVNEYEWGGYLIWALPEQKVFIDGRSDVFEWTGVLGEFGRWALLEEDPRILLDKYQVQYCLIRKTAPMAAVLPYVPGWKNAYRDSVSVIFTRN